MSKGFCFLIDDDADDREIFAMALKKANAAYVCTMAKNGKEAIEAMSSCDKVPGHIFVDLNMPLVSGRDCVTAFKRLNHLENVPIIVYTTSSNEKDVNDVKKLGASHYLVKPTKFSALVALLEDIFTKNSLPFFIDANN